MEVLSDDIRRMAFTWTLPTVSRSVVIGSC